MINALYPSWILIFLLNVLSCRSSGQVEQIELPIAAETPSLQQLKKTSRQHRNITVVYGSQKAGIAKAYQELLADLPTNARRYTIEVKSDQELDSTDLAEKILYLIGTPQSNAILAQMANQLPIGFEKEALRLGEQRFVGQAHLIKMAFYPNPFQPRLPINLLTGVDDQSIIQQLRKEKAEGESPLRLRWSYEVFRGSNRIMLGNFSETDWSMDKKTHFDFTLNDTIATTEHFHFITHQPLPKSFDIQSLKSDCEKRFQQMVEFSGNAQPFPQRIAYHIYTTAEDKGMMTNNTAQAHYDFSKFAVHTVINQQFTNNFIEKENTLILRHLLGESETQALLAGLSICFTKQWQQKGYEYWAVKLHVSGNTIRLKDLFNNEIFQQESWLIKSCLSGVLVDFLVKEFGQQDFLKHYKNWQPDSATIDQLQKKWIKYLDQLAANLDIQKNTMAKQKSFPYLKGFNFAHEGYSIYNGYISRKASSSLKRLSAIGTNAASIIPYSYMRDPKKASHIPFIRSAGAENDESVIHSAFVAKQLGMTTMLKPQVWISGSWPGDISMSSEAEWQQFFDYYYRWIRHYALLAEIHQIDFLCVGVEFSKATLSHEQNWRAIFRKLRGLYSGPMTYCANWGNEFEKVTFWDELDYIGLSCYYPLSKANEVSEQELQKNFNKILSKIKGVQQKYNKPVLLTEIGFRSVDHPWKDPHASPDGRSPNEQHQKMCYQAIFKALQNQDWCHGLFLWKWPCHMEYNNPEGFSPNEKAAEKVIEQWFQKLN